MAPGKGIPKRKSSEPVEFPKFKPQKLPSRRPAKAPERRKTPVPA